MHFGQLFLIFAFYLSVYFLLPLLLLIVLGLPTKVERIGVQHTPASGFPRRKVQVCIIGARCYSRLYRGVTVQNIHTVSRRERQDLNTGVRNTIISSRYIHMQASPSCSVYEQPHIIQYRVLLIVPYNACRVVGQGNDRQPARSTFSNPRHTRCFGCFWGYFSSLAMILLSTGNKPLCLSFLGDSYLCRWIYLLRRMDRRRTARARQDALRVRY